MEYGGFVFAAFVALVGIIIALFMLYQERHGMYKSLRPTHPSRRS